MKKLFLGIMAVLVILVLGVVVYIIQNYHSSTLGALNELKKKTGGEVLSLSDDTLALVIHEDGNISIAYSEALYTAGLYKDFDIYQSLLNVYDIRQENDIPYTNSPKEAGLSFGLVKNRDIEYSIREMKLLNENATIVFHLYEYIDDPELKDIKLWYVYSDFAPGSSVNELYFLDKEKEEVQLNKIFVQK
ncbi:hypothetical protein [Psychrobacillus sp. NPDC096623]|uniref:hypothetical protein n=1 Tax=Psychrobacillus sp. NPDC096623 TaxID=3364492 RepID=UPI0038014FD1